MGPLSGGGPAALPPAFLPSPAEFKKSFENDSQSSDNVNFLKVQWSSRQLPTVRGLFLPPPLTHPLLPHPQLELPCKDSPLVCQRGRGLCRSQVGSQGSPPSRWPSTCGKACQTPTALWSLVAHWVRYEPSRLRRAVAGLAKVQGGQEERAPPRGLPCKESVPLGPF